MQEDVISGISHRFQQLSQSQGQVTHVLLTRSPLTTRASPRSPFDLHVLSTPPAFVLSQNQTLRKCQHGTPTTKAAKATDTRNKHPPATAGTQKDLTKKHTPKKRGTSISQTSPPHNQTTHHNGRQPSHTTSQNGIDYMAHC